MIVTYPLGLLIRYLGEKERKRVLYLHDQSKNFKALAGSEVKILGKDVVASHKVVCALIFFPIAFFVFYFFHHLLMKYLLDDK